MRWRVWFHRSRSVGWMILGALSFPMGWAHSIVLVWVASLYANVASDWSASEAADNREVIERLERIEALLNPSATRGSGRRGRSGTARPTLGGSEPWSRARAARTRRRQAPTRRG